MARKYLAENVFDTAISRMAELMEEGHRICVSFSAGKDSGVLLETTLIAAEMTGYGQVDVVLRDEEIMFPGTYEYADRTARRPEIRFHHFIAKQPIINCFNRRSPYWWVFDDEVAPEDWLRLPPGWDEAGRPPLEGGVSWTPAGWTEGGGVHCIDEKHIEAMVTQERFPPAEGKTLFDAIGLRVTESRGRLFGIYSSGGHITKPRPNGVRKVRPIYDWDDSDVWRGIFVNRWDFNEAYNILRRLGAPRHDLRIAPPTMNAAGTRVLKRAAQAWPRWFDKVNHRCPGIKTAAQFGIRAVSPQRRSGETWEQCFWRECVEDAPDWIAERAESVVRRVSRAHGRHAAGDAYNVATHERSRLMVRSIQEELAEGRGHTPEDVKLGLLPEVNACWQCAGDVGSWKNMSTYLYLGDPFAIKTGSMLKAVEPEFFRPGAGVWGGIPTFA